MKCNAPGCSAEIESVGHGRPRRFCSARCKMRVWRAEKRKKGKVKRFPKPVAVKSLNPADVAPKTLPPDLAPEANEWALHIFTTFVVTREAKPLVIAAAYALTRAVNAAKEIDLHGHTIVTERGIFANPSVSIERQAQSLFSRLYKQISEALSRNEEKSIESAEERFFA